MLKTKHANVYSGTNNIFSTTGATNGAVAAYHSGAL